MPTLKLLEMLLIGQTHVRLCPNHKNIKRFFYIVQKTAGIMHTYMSSVYQRSALRCGFCSLTSVFMCVVCTQNSHVQLFSRNNNIKKWDSHKENLGQATTIVGDNHFPMMSTNGTSVSIHSLTMG